VAIEVEPQVDEVRPRFGGVRLAVHPALLFVARNLQASGELGADEALVVVRRRIDQVPEELLLGPTGGGQAGTRRRQLDAYSQARPQNRLHIPLPMKDREDLQRIGSRFVDYEVREDPVKQDSLGGKVGAAMSGIGDGGQLVERLQYFLHDSICHLQALSLEQV
jgi:hypothetical protein